MVAVRDAEVVHPLTGLAVLSRVGVQSGRSYDVRVQYLRGGLFIDFGPVTWSYMADGTLLRADNNFITVDRS